MQLKIQRTQRMGGALGTTVVFCLDVRADYSAVESSNIGRYRLGKQLIYSSQAARRHAENSRKHLARAQGDDVRDQAAGLSRGILSLALAKMNLNVSIASLGRGHHIECRDLAELLSAEETLMEACRNVKKYLAAAATFSGNVTLVDFDNNESTIVSPGKLELEVLPPPAGDMRGRLLAGPSSRLQFNSFDGFRASVTEWVRERYRARPEVVVVLWPGLFFLALFFLFLLIRH